MRITRPLLSATRVRRPRLGQTNSSFASSLPPLSSPCRRCLSESRKLQDSQEQNEQPPSSPPSSPPSNAPSGAIIFSGIQPTGVPHLGNYLGALLRWVQLQEGAASDKSTQLYFSVVDLHALTSVQAASSNNGAVLRQRRRGTLAALLAIGLDPERCVLFYQSAVPAHSELMWLLSCTASVGYLSRMTQWKVWPFLTPVLSGL
jgi:tryptophanyl-tRNA synthetase